jgi:hypothetical protein
MFEIIIRLAAGARRGEGWLLGVLSRTKFCCFARILAVVPPAAASYARSTVIQIRIYWFFAKTSRFFATVLRHYCESWSEIEQIFSQSLYSIMPEKIPGN